MKTLLLLTDVFGNYGGIQTFNRTIVKAFAELAGPMDVEPRVHALNDSGHLPTDLRYLGNTAFRGFGRSKAAFLAASLDTARGVDVVVLGHVNFLSLVPLLKLTSPSTRIILTAFGIDVWRRLSLHNRIALSWVDRILSISEYTKAKMIEANQMPDLNCQILPCALDPFYGEENHVDRQGTRSEVVLLTVSRLDQQETYKKIDLVIRSLPGLIKGFPQTRYVIVGDGSDKQRLVNLANDLGVSDRVTFAGKVDSNQLARYYRECDIFILPSLREGFGIVFLEAMFYAKPCIGARAAAVPEVIRDRVTGFLAAPDDLGSLQAQIEKLVADSSLRHSMGLAGKHRLETVFSFETFKGRLASILSDLTN